MIGLDIKVKNKYNNYLHKLLNGIDFNKYSWDILTDDFLYSENGETKENLFGKNTLSGEEFLKCISRDSYYMIFVDIKAYPIGSTSSRINTMEDFLNSNCEFILLCTDSMFIEVYSKDNYLLDKIYNNCKYNMFEEIQYKSISDVIGRSLVAW